MRLALENQAYLTWKGNIMPKVPERKLSYGEAQENKKKAIAFKKIKPNAKQRPKKNYTAFNRWV